MFKKKALALSILALLATANTSFAEDSNEYLYIQTNNVEENQNALGKYKRNSDGTVSFVDFYKTEGTGINNNTNGKLGPQDNDSQIIITEDKKFIYTVNVHSNTIAGFKTSKDGKLTPVPGSPFSSHGIAPVSINASGDVLMAANRNEDYHQKDTLGEAKGASYVSFKIEKDGSLKFVDKFEVEGFQKPTQIHASYTVDGLFFGNDFQVDFDADGEGKQSFLVGPETRLQGQLHSFKVDKDGKIKEMDRQSLPETIENYKYIGSPGVPTMPLGIWDHPKENILYVGFVTRNQLGVYTYDESGKLKFISAVENSGQDICWVLTNKEGTILYTVNNLPRLGTDQKASTISVYDISGENKLKPVEIQVIEVPMPLESFVNNRLVKQPGSTAFEIALSSDEKQVYLVNQRINQTPENKDPDGNILHVFDVDKDGKLTHASSRSLMKDGFPSNSRTQGALSVDF